MSLDAAARWARKVEERGECTCGRPKGHAGWIKCLERAVKNTLLTDDDDESSR